MANCGPNTLMISRPSQTEYTQAAAVGSITVNTDICGTSACHAPVAPHGRVLSPRRFREKVREDLKDYVLLMLGAPTIKIELDSQALDLCIDQTLKIYEDFAPREFFDYYTFNTLPGKSVYKLPDDVGIVRNVFYKSQPRFAFTANDLGGSIPIEYFYPGGAYASIQGGLIDPVQPIWGRMGEWVLYKQYEQMFASTSSQIGGWEWVSDMGHIKLYPTPCGMQKVMVHYLQKCKDWKEVNQAMQDGCMCHAMIILGHIRGKYAQPPGPGGGMQLDGDYMRTKGWELKEKWSEELITKYGDILPISLH
jgi:hypothetical protein